MARLPTINGDKNVWGEVLNSYLLASHNEDGTLKDIGVLATKYTKPSGGIPATDLDAPTQAMLNGPTIYVQSTAPSSPSEGDLWVDTA